MKLSSSPFRPSRLELPRFSRARREVLHLTYLPESRSPYFCHPCLLRSGKVALAVKFPESGWSSIQNSTAISADLESRPRLLSQSPAALQLKLPSPLNLNQMDSVQLKSAIIEQVRNESRVANAQKLLQVRRTSREHCSFWNSMQRKAQNFANRLGI